MKVTKNWKRIVAGIMAGMMLFLSIDFSGMTAFAINEKEDVPTGRVPLEFISVEDVSFSGEVYDYEQLAQLQTFSMVYNNEWDKYNTYFYYNQLSEEWKTVWDALDVVCLETMTSSDDALYSESDNLYYLDLVTLPENVTVEDAKTFLEIFLASNPQYYFLSNMLIGSYDETETYLTAVSLCLYNAFGKGEDRAVATEAFQAKIIEVEQGIEALGNVSDSVKLKYIHDYVVSHTTYNYVIIEDDDTTEDINESEITDEEDEIAISQSAYSALCMGSTVCTGYSEAMTILCNGVGIDTISVTSINHMWNKVRIEDSWYNVDATWADQNVISYQYYGRSDEVYQNDASLENSLSHTELSQWDAYVPLCTLDTAPVSPYDVVGVFPEITNTAPIPHIIASGTGNGKYVISINPTVIDVTNNTTSIYYTTDGSIPSVASSKAIKYTEPFVVEENYDIRAICVNDRCFDSAVVRGVQVPNIENLKVDNRFYNKITVSWDSLGDKVDGYEIRVVDHESEEEIDTILVDKSKSSCVIDTANFEAGTKLRIYVCSYVGNGNNIQYSGEYITTSTVLAEPLSDIALKWYVRTWNNTNCLAINLESGYLLYHYVIENGFNPYETGADMPTMEGVPHFYLFDPEFAPYNEKGYVVVCDRNMTTAWQEPGVLVGGEFKEPILQPISDVEFSATGQTATLTATITNPMENFDYRYQWYVSDSEEGDAVAIEDATNSTYVVSVDADETKYYFCRVTCEYGEIMYVDTNNGNGSRTAVSGSMVNVDIQISPIEDQTYTALDITPEFEVKINDVLLTKGEDYTVSYSNNKDVGTARVQIIFCGDYSGTKTVTFKIVAAGVKSEFVQAIPSQVYTGGKITPNVIVTGLNGEELQKGEDYVISYGENTNVESGGSVHITFIKNYSGTVHSAFQITPKELNSENVVAEDLIYTGSVVPHKFVISDGRFTLVEGVDYQVIYAEDVDRINVGDISATINFINNYKGTAEISYKILPKSAESLQITAEDQEYTGNEVITDILVMDGELELKEGIDYDVVYSNNIELSTDELLAQATLTFKGNYTGTRTVGYKILPRDAEDCTVEFAVPNQVYSYTGEVIKPEVVVTFGDKVLVEGTDYSVKYDYDKNVGIKKIQVDFKGNYTGTSYAQFSVISKSITAADLVIEGIQDVFYNGAAIIPQITIRDIDLLGTIGEVLREGVDYIITIVDNVLAGIAKITIHFLGFDNDLNNGNYNGDDIVIDFNIKARSTEHVKITAIPEQRYTGKAITPDVEIKDTQANITLVKGQDYTVEYKNNVNEGTATVVVSFKGNFTGEPMTTTFTIVNPVPTTITSNTFHVNQSTGYISKITVGTTVDKLWGSLNEKDYVVIYDKNGNVVTGNTALATGMTASIMDEGTATKKYTVVVTGDTNGDGKINITDMIAVKACTLKKSGLSGAYEKAGDVNGDGKINITDFIKVKATTLKKDSITGVAVK